MTCRYHDENFIFLCYELLMKNFQMLISQIKDLDILPDNSKTVLGFNDSSLI